MITSIIKKLNHWLYIFCLALFITSSVLGQKLTKVDWPPGTLYLNDSLYIDSHPVSNYMFKEFESFFLSSENSELKNINDYALFTGMPEDKYYKIVQKYAHLSDSIIVSKQVKTYEDYSLRFNPFLAATELKAKLYCQWRTDMVSAYKLVSRIERRDNRKTFPKLLYRLPTLNELELARNHFLKNKKLRLRNSPLTPLNTTVGTKKLNMFDSLVEITADRVPILTDDKNHTTFRCICEVSQ